MWPDRIKLPLHFDVDKMKEDLHLLDCTEWIQHFVRQNYEGDWSVLPLRGPAGATHPILMSYSDPSCKAFSDTPFLQMLNYIPLALKKFKCQMLSVRLMKLTADSVIKSHVDHDLDAETGTARLHIPIVTNKDVIFLLNQKPVPWLPGECWYLRLSDPHAVCNNSATDRVHLVLDITVNDWFSTLLNQNDNKM